MPNGFKQIDETTDPKIAQMLLAERLNHLIEQQDDMQNKLDEITKTSAVNKWLQGILVPSVIIALIKAFLF